MSQTIITKRIYFLGAGSTVFCRLPSTEEQTNRLKNLCFCEEEFLIDDKPIPSNAIEAVTLFKRFVCDYFTKDNFNINLLFNLCDGHIQKQLGLYANGHYYEVNDLLKIKKTVKAIIFSIFKAALENNGSQFSKIKDFYKTLAEKALRQKLNDAKTNNVRNRDFIFTDYAVINLNWDLLSIIPMLQAHKELNNTNDYYTTFAERATKVKIFNDFASFMACYNGNDDYVWYPYNESVAVRINDIEHNPDKIVTLVKTFFPHGLMNLYRCRWCGKHTMYLKDMDVHTLVKDRDYFSNKKLFDCPHCNCEVDELDIEYLEQTNHKISNSYLDEIKLDMNTVMANAEEIIFIGYSLPADDIDYNESLIAFCTKVKRIKIVLFDSKYSNDNVFHPFEYFTEFNNDKTLETMQRFKNIFHGKDVSFNLCGSPKCFSCSELYE